MAGGLFSSLDNMILDSNNIFRASIQIFPRILLACPLLWDGRSGVRTQKGKTAYSSTRLPVLRLQDKKASLYYRIVFLFNSRLY